MTHRTVTFLLAITLLTICPQCTIEKRLYRKGWYISMNRHERSHADESKPEISEAIVEISALRPNDSTVVAMTDEPQVLLPERRIPSIVPPIAEHLQSFPASSVKEAEPERPIVKEHQQKPLTHWSQHKKRTAVIVTSIFLALTVLAMIGLYAAIYGSGLTLGGFFLAVFTFILLSGLALVLLIMLIVFLSRRTAEQMQRQDDEEKEKEEERREELKNYPPEERELILEQERAAADKKKRERGVIIVGAGLLALLVLVLVAS